MILNTKQHGIEPGSTAASNLFVNAITLSFARSATFENCIASVDWGAFTRAAASCMLLERITVRIEEGFNEAKTAWMVHAHKHFELLGQETGVQFVMRESTRDELYSIPM